MNLSVESSRHTSRDMDCNVEVSLDNSGTDKLVDTNCDVMIEHNPKAINSSLIQISASTVQAVGVNEQS